MYAKRNRQIGGSRWRFRQSSASSTKSPSRRARSRYRERGTGEPIVFVHGALVNADLWRKVVPELAKDFRCIAPDLPLGSHERAMPADADLSPPGVAKLIADFIAALDLDNVTLVGNDTGGALCQLRRHAAPGAHRAAGADELRRLRQVPAEHLQAACSAPRSIPGFVCGARPADAASTALRNSPDRVRLAVEATASRPRSPKAGVRPGAEGPRRAPRHDQAAEGRQPALHAGGGDAVQGVRQAGADRVGPRRRTSSRSSTASGSRATSRRGGSSGSRTRCTFVSGGPAGAARRS